MANHWRRKMENNPRLNWAESRIQSGVRWPWRGVIILVVYCWIAQPQWVAGQNDAASVPPDSQAQPIDLPTALALVEANNPTIELARARIVEANEKVQQARALWLPSLQSGPSYVRHDGEIQNIDGLMYPVSKYNLFLGGGMVMRWRPSDVLLEPVIARKLLDAQHAATQAITYSIQLDVVVAYLDLLRAYGNLAINAETLARADEILANVPVLAKKGIQTSPADRSRAEAEVNTRRELAIDLQAQVIVASGRLVRMLRLKTTQDLRPTDATVLPITLVPATIPLEQLVAMGLQHRPEVAQNQSLVGAAETRLQQARLTPLLPRFDVGYSSGDFMGQHFGFNNGDPRVIGSGIRGDGVAQATWELRNMGAGDLAQIRIRKAQIAETEAQTAETQTRVVEDVTVAAKLAFNYRSAFNAAEASVRKALDTWEGLRQVALAKLPAAKTYSTLELVLAEQRLYQARSRYLTVVIGYNKAQFQLYWALGQPPASALHEATAEPVELPVVPGQGHP